MRRSLLSVIAVALLLVAPNATLYCLALCAPAAAVTTECHHDSPRPDDPQVQDGDSCFEAIGEAWVFLGEASSSRGLHPSVHAGEILTVTELQIADTAFLPVDRLPHHTSPPLTVPLRV
jgi:hypothetical protein